MSGSSKQGHAESQKRPILTAFNAMKLAISIVVMIMFVQAAGSPHAKSDPMYEKKLPAITQTAHAEALPKSKSVAPAVVATAPTPVVTPPTPPTCPDTQWIWAQDGQCHDKPVVASPVASAPTTQATYAGSCANQDSLHGMDYVFCHESTYNATATNSEGCVGLGQACPASKLYAVCPTLDVSCQISYFSSYAASRYGGWDGAESFWRSHRWW
jgi:hypothetical protein